MPNLILLAAVASVRVGLYPVSLPPGQEPLRERLSAQLHEGAATLPGVQAFDLVVPQASCAPGGGACLSEVARRSGVDEVLTTVVEARSSGFRFHLRAFEQGKLRDEVEEDVKGGPLDLAAALEHGVCRAMGAAPCVGELRLQSGEDVAGNELVVDGFSRGPLPAAPLQLPVGRHLVQVGDSELRVRVSYGRVARARCEQRQGAPALMEDAGDPIRETVTAPAVPLAATSALPVPTVQTRSRAALTLFAAGGALLVAAGGAELYSRVAASQLDARYRGGALTAADSSRYGAVQRTGILATALAATGLGAIAASGLVLAFSPDGASLFGRF